MDDDVKLPINKNTEMSTEDIYILWDCLIYGGLGSLAGIAAQLRSAEPLTKRSFFSALINSAMFSIAIGYFIIWKYGETNYLLAIVLSILSGLGGTSLVDFAFGLAKMYFKRRVDYETPEKRS